MLCADHATTLAANRQRQSRLQKYVQDSLGLPKFVTDLLVEDNKSRNNPEKELHRMLAQFTKPDNRITGETLVDTCSKARHTDYAHEKL